MKNLKAQEAAPAFFVISVIVTILLYVVPYGDVIGYPLVLLSTLFHEMGHGIAAVLAGGDFHKFYMWTNGSGVAYSSGVTGAFGRAFVSAGGLVGPAITAAIGLVMARNAKSARVGLIVLGVGLVISEILVVRGLFGMIFVGVFAAICLGLAFKAPPWVGQLAMVFVCVQLALSVFSRGDYLFTATANTAKGPMPSDVAQMSDALWLPYWFWGALCGLISVAALFFGARAFFKPLREKAKATAS